MPSKRTLLGQDLYAMCSPRKYIKIILLIIYSQRCPVLEGNILKTLYKQNVEGLGEREIGRDLDMKQETLQSFIQGSMNQRSHELVGQQLSLANRSSTCPEPTKVMGQILRRNSCRKRKGVRASDFLETTKPKAFLINSLG